MKAKPLPPIDYIRARLEYRPSTGEFVWRDHPDLSSRCKPGDVAGSINSDGYRCIAIKGALFAAHRLAWAWIYRFDPLEYGSSYQIDHINGDRADNRIANLRIVTSAENQRNAARSRNNTSGHTGVSWDKAEGKWRAQIQLNGKSRHLGYFNNIDDAVDARQAANEQFGFHENHGRGEAA